MLLALCTDMDHNKYVSTADCSGFHKEIDKNPVENAIVRRQARAVLWKTFEGRQIHAGM